MVAVGLALGLAAGVSPGPLMVLVITQALRGGWRAGVVTAAAPLVSDAVVIVGVLLVLSALPQRVLPVMGVVGGAYVIWSGVETWREARHGRVRGWDGAATKAFRRAVMVNILSPHPWLSWATALGPLLVTTWHRSEGAAVAFVAGFYVSLVGAKVAVAVLVAGGRGRLTDTGYRRALRVGAFLLAAAGVALIVEFLPRAVS
ncbi:LysE family transporter [Actinoplanes sp. NPDC049596]|uniref:LysE family translocator n=1 Tax=unclassified Actinoplanes TaxID=2626549 RepID=UPI0034253CCC